MHACMHASYLHVKMTIIARVIVIVILQIFVILAGVVNYNSNYTPACRPGRGPSAPGGCRTGWAREPIIITTLTITNIIVTIAILLLLI